MTTLLCDADGCLFPSEEPAFEASAAVLNGFLRAAGADREFDPEWLRRTTTGKNFRTTARELAAAEGLRIDEGELERWVAAERARVTRHLVAVLVPDAAVAEPLRELAGSHRVAVVSSSAVSRVRACLEATGLDGYFPPGALFSAEDSLPKPVGKPDPAIYLHALERLAVGADEAVAVEDSVPGARAAIAAGIATIGMLAFVPPAERLERRRCLLAAGVIDVAPSWDGVAGLLGASETRAGEVFA